MLTLKVTGIVQETPDTKTIQFKPPGLKKVRYRAGQYITLIFTINGRRFQRPYSLSSSSLKDPQIHVTVKRIPGGIVSNHIFDKVNLGDFIEMIEPLGDFILHESIFTDSSTHLVFWGCGSGITPLFSMLNELHVGGFKGSVTLVYGNSTKSSAIFYDQLQTMEARWKRFTMINFFSKEVTLPETACTGRIDSSNVIQELQTLGKLENSRHYICGPPELKRELIVVLNRSGVPRAHVFTEDFELNFSAEQLKDIITRTVLIENLDDLTEVEVIRGKTILEAALDAMLEIPYSCQTGNCGLCRAKLVSGSVKMVRQDEANDLSNDEFLLCCTFPLSDNVKLLIANT